MIHYDEQQKVFHLSNKIISYIIGIEEKGLLAHIYYGDKIKQYQGNFSYPRFERSFSTNFEGDTSRVYSRDTLLQEYSTLGSGDFRIPSIEIENYLGNTVCDFRYENHTIVSGKPHLDGLPQTWIEKQEEAQTLQIFLKDQNNHLELCLSYTIFENYAVIARNVVVKNVGSQPIYLGKVASLSLDLPYEKRELIHLPGAWGNERQLTREPLSRGIRIFDSKRGTSSHQENPFLSLVSPQTTENQGESIGFCLVYSGNHETALEVDQYEQVRLTMGINSSGFKWYLKPDESFQTPEALMVYSNLGLNGMSQEFHRLFQNQLIRSQFSKKERPVLINNWEATYFEFNEEKIKSLMESSAEIGVELFVLDDGWFGQRNSDQTSLGDWFVNHEKLPSGIGYLADYAHNLGMQFGLWVEPEMISRDSQLFNMHPDWYLHVPHQEASQSRSQYVLDLTRNDVLEYIYQVLYKILSQNHIDYVKWDMNRYLTDVFSTLLPAEQEQEVAHRYVLNLYQLMERLTAAFPQILFEACSGGGGRFDAGMLYYMPQIWTSDNSDAIARLSIQYGTSLLYPVSTMGAHVSAVPNHQNGRITSLKTRGAIAMSGILGYELDPTKLSQSEKDEISWQIKEYKEERITRQFGKFSRLVSPFESNACAWQVMSEDGSEIIVTYTTVLSHAAPPLERLKLVDLLTGTLYFCKELNQTFGADELMKIGLYLDPIFNRGDFESRIFHFRKINN